MFKYDRVNLGGRAHAMAQWGTRADRLDHRGAGTEQYGRQRPRRERIGESDHGERRSLSEHAGGNQMFAAPPIGQRAGDQLAEAPNRGIDRGEDSDPGHRQSGGGERIVNSS
jgi:hypothetical protein